MATFMPTGGSMKINEMYIFKSLHLNKTQGDGSSSSFSHSLIARGCVRFAATFMIIGLGMVQVTIHIGLC
ncbi:unnamed protein product [Coffea canephora]|uniref:DH200=94 genomic scaffold, scaffold_1356 n=1 Tax=Coffea canephora TaxID=49390 RepID=A0A068VIM6_COFCA|nr:unnamed protein product [Coffea canephora]